jgi:hypothetical protein
MRVGRHRKHVFAPVAIGEGAVWRLRPASSLDVEIATARVKRQLAGLMTGSEQAARLAAIFGPSLELGGEVDRLVAVSALLGDVELACLCSDGWTGIEDDDGVVIAEPDPGSVAFLLADQVVLGRVRQVLYADVRAETHEKNGSAASPDGGAATVRGPAPTAGRSVPLAPSAGSGSPESDALN